jgi:hypothetical protein
MSKSLWVGVLAAAVWLLATPSTNAGEPVFTLKIGGDANAGTFNLKLGDVPTDDLQAIRGGHGGGHGGHGGHSGHFGHGGHSGHYGHVGHYGRSNYGGYGRYGYGGYGGYGRYGYGGYGRYGYGGYGYSYYRPYYYGSYYNSGYYQPYYYGNGYYQPYCGISLTVEEPAQPVGKSPTVSPYFRVPPMPNADQPAPTPIPAPKKVPNDGTFPYDGGPSNPVPIPKIEDDKQPLKTPPLLVPLEGRPVSIPTTTAKPATKITYPAYGEKSSQPKAQPQDDNTRRVSR